MIDRATMLKRKAIGKTFIDKYFRELNTVSNKEINSDDLLSIEDTYQYIDSISNIRKLNHYKSEPFEFHDKNRLTDFFIDIINKKNGKAILITKYSEYCGALPLNGLQDFNFNFPYNAEHSGLITLILEDLSNELILDFWDDQGQKLIEIETYGNEWGLIG